MDSNPYWMENDYGQFVYTEAAQLLFDEGEATALAIRADAEKRVDAAREELSPRIEAAFRLWQKARAEK